MKRYLLIIYILLLACTLGAGPASVSITLTTSVPGYLYHGFLDSSNPTAFVVTSPTVNDAFNPAGAVLNYGIRTNVRLPLTVKATIAPFEEQDVAEPAIVPITNINVKYLTGDSIPAPYIASEGKYNLLQLTPQSGTIFYAYTLTVFADQNIVLTSPAGNYVSTVEIDIATDS
ncbi:MAG: hypothetical protein JEY71_03055 [Sphaerochaeta sp.]|nr:hypothetical protein [Sphaerochaeta sp.]